MNKTRKITLILDEEIYQALKNEIGIKKVCDSFFGITNELALHIIRAIEHKENSITLILKNDNQTNNA